MTIGFDKYLYRSAIADTLLPASTTADSLVAPWHAKTTRGFKPIK
jgi:hypothetical protein